MSGTAGSDDVLELLGVTLIEDGAIDQRSLDRARRVAAETGGRLDRILTQLGIVSERGLAVALAQMLELPLAGNADYPDEPLFIERLKPKFLRRARAMPIAADQDCVTLAMADPLDRFTRDAVGVALGRRVNPAVAVPVEFDAAFERLYPEANDADDAAVLDDTTADGETA